MANALTIGLHFAVWLLDGIDLTQRLTHSAPAVTLSGSDTVVWRSEREQDVSPTSYSVGFGRHEHRPVHLFSAHRRRPALRHNADQLVEDLVTCFATSGEAGETLTSGVPLVHDAANFQIRSYLFQVRIELQKV